MDGKRRWQPLGEPVLQERGRAEDGAEGQGRGERTDDVRGRYATVEPFHHRRGQPAHIAHGERQPRVDETEGGEEVGGGAAAELV
ncbi:hypothetical protein ADK70_21200, partial [Streptomyces rimosus subsp. pseudoverticillatus]